ncbi:putative transcription factor bHLH family [Helianthus annuus]|nr:putative transcription factor bHLH family [Helianthus annuus]KAJ0472239.1 putative transcription factor bHLH family [Helianthus annuus]KAJ0647837.1 putative transcription factor bHLH family [Helianthus annuus]KAJ0651700.1 putative transcription factor bHLH family [Helianthus annuus]
MQMQHPSKQQQGLLQDLFTPITHTWTTFPDEDVGFLHSFGDNTFNEEDNSYLASSSTIMEHILSSLQPTCDPNLNSFTAVNIPNSSSFEQKIYGHDDKPKPVASFQEGYPRIVEQKDDKIHEEKQAVNGEKKSKSKKVEGQPSKNLMAERRRRKRLNDRLSMLRSIVPRISKMDRTSILGDTIEYMKELMEKVSILKGQDVGTDSNSLNLIVNEAKPRNLPKRRNTETHVQICCSTNPGLLLSTVNALQVLGLDIQNCVMSSFGDFTFQASCSEAPDHMMTSSEEIKQILTRNAGYGYGGPSL